MAEPLKAQFGADIPTRISAMIKAVHQDLDESAFIAQCLNGNSQHSYDEMELTARARHISLTLAEYLPADFASASEVLLASLGPPLPDDKNFGMAPFIYLPHVYYTAEYGLQDFTSAMALQHALTQRFTAEFSIRAFLQHHEQRTLDQLDSWTDDPSSHVRRLVSEGTRPRLPWASRLPRFQQNPTAVLVLLDKLKDDPSLYVRRSVANNLNDIYKDNPRVVLDTLSDWMQNANANRIWIIKHALRHAVKQGDKKALRLLGYRGAAFIQCTQTGVTPASVTIGNQVSLEVTLHNPTDETHRLMIDARIHFVKKNQTTQARVFKLKDSQILPGETLQVSKSVSLKQQTTRTHYPGKHRVELILNGDSRPLGDFTVLANKNVYTE